MSSLFHIHVTGVRVAARLRDARSGPVPLLVSVVMAFQGPERFTEESVIHETLDYGRIVRLIGAEIGGDAEFAGLEDVAGLVADRCMALDPRVRHVRVQVAGQPHGDGPSETAVAERPEPQR